MQQANLENANPLAVITGAAGGMGSACALRFLQRGYSLLLIDRLREPLEVLSKKLVRMPGQTITLLVGDIAGEGFPESLIEQIGSRKIGALVHTAGLSPTMGTSAEIVDVNYGATVRIVKATRPLMSDGACAVLFASSAGHQMDVPEFSRVVSEVLGSDDGSALLSIAPTPGHAYGLSKLAVLRFVERQASEYARVGARIMSISPGLIDTPMGRAEQKAHPDMDRLLSLTPAGRYGTGDDIAAVAEFLCSPEASYVSGSDVKVDGGMLGATRS